MRKKIHNKENAYYKYKIKPIFHYNIHWLKNNAFRLKTNIPVEITFHIWVNDGSTMIATEGNFTNQNEYHDWAQDINIHFNKQTKNM